jgi:hypothetical protein
VRTHKKHTYTNTQIYQIHQIHHIQTHPPTHTPTISKQIALSLAPAPTHSIHEFLPSSST